MADCIVELSLRESMQGCSLNLASPQSFRLSELTRQIAALDGPAVESIDYRHWLQLCGEHPATRRLASVMPTELAEHATEPEISARIGLSNAVAELDREGRTYPAMTTDFLRDYVAWRYRSLQSG